MMKEKKYAGVVVPMVTPLNSDLSIDRLAAASLSKFLVEAGTVPFVLGSTGEGVSMTLAQKTELVEACSKAINGKALLYAGISGNSLHGAIEESEQFAQAGANVVVATLPFYYPINIQQMTRFFESLADKSALPVVIYNMPAMVKNSIPLEVVDVLCQHPNIVALKDSERDIERHNQLILRFKDEPNFSFLIGWAANSVEGLRQGADGIVPSTGNIVPELYTQLFQAVRQGQLETAMQLQQQTDVISALYQANRDLSHSIPALKVMMHLKGLCGTQVMPPMYTLNANDEAAYRNYITDEFKKLNF